MAHLSAAGRIIARPAGRQAGDLTVKSWRLAGHFGRTWRALSVSSVGFAEVDPVSRLGVLHPPSSRWGHAAHGLSENVAAVSSTVVTYLKVTVSCSSHGENG